MKQDLTGGYCPRCDTVWAQPGVCRCWVISKELADKIDKEYDRLFAKDNAKIVNIDKTKMSEEDKIYWDKAKSDINNKSVFETETWNKAIEAAAEKCCTICLASANIRKLKR
jgi:hypothetical protein